MKKTFYFFTAVFLMANLALNAQTLVNPNGGFEETEIGQYFKGDDVAGWSLDYTEDGSITTFPEFFIVEDVVKEGSRALWMILNEVGGNDWSVQVVNEPIPVETNTYYVYSVWAMAEGHDGLRVNFTVGNLTYAEMGRRGNEEMPNGEWKNVVFLFKNTNNDTLRAPLHFSLSANADLVPANFYIDDLQIFYSPLASAETNEGGDTVIIEFEWPINEIPAGFDPTAFTVSVNGTANAVTAVTQHEEYLHLQLTSSFSIGDMIFISYTKPGSDYLTYSTAPGTPPTPDVESFSGIPVSNEIIVGIYSYRINKNIKLFPNPVENNLTLSGLESVSSIEILTVSGQVIDSYKVYDSTHIIDVADLHKGIYFVKVKGDKGFATLKFIK